MKIDQYIGELLYDHDCVIVSDLGGFITNSKPASINPALHVISPPSKKLAFNASLKNNDGLLANHIARQTMLNYVDACEVIRDYVKTATSGMKSGQKLKIDKVGVLYLDQEDRLQFLPDQHANYLVESFGMSPVHAPVIRREMQYAVENITVRNIIPRNPKEMKRVGWKILEMVPAAAVLAILLMTPPVLREFNSNMSSMLPFSRMNEFLDKIKGEHRDKPQVTIPHTNIFEIPPAASVHHPAAETTEHASVNSEAVPVNKIEASETLRSEAPADKTETASIAVTPIPVTKVGDRTYYIIGGCFRSLENAEKFVVDMKAKNMEAVMIGQNKSGLYLVSLFSSSSYNQTTDVLPEIKSNLVESAWVMKK